MKNTHYIRGNSIISVFVILVMHTVYGESSMNQLQKVFHHQGMFGDKVVCYFSRDPICNYLPEKPETSAQRTDQSTQKNIVFFLPMTQISSKDAREMINTINNVKKDSYGIRFTEVKQPINGIKITIAYNPNMIICDYAVFDSISMRKALIFNFHQKVVLEEMKQKTDKILRYACNNTAQKKDKHLVKIMLDCGHGGKDNGTTAQGIKEKDINFAVGSKTADLLREKGFNVLLTRNSDTFVPLDMRTLSANNNHADIFISIHANSAPKSEASGIETYWSCRENIKRISLHDTISYQNSINEHAKKLDQASKLLASNIHNNVINKVNERHVVLDRNVNESLAQVLIGTDMPSALIEIGFVSNQQEAKKLVDHNYQYLIAQGICKGIEMYYNHTIQS